MSSQPDQRIKENIDNTAEQTKLELTKLRAEYEEFKRNAQPRVKEAENFLASPSAIGFYQGFVAGVVIVLSYVKYKGN